MGKPYHHGNLRRCLIEKGIEIINTEGEENLSMRKLGLACGVSGAAPYSHFNSKEKLLEAMQEYVVERLMKKMNAAIETCEDKDSTEVIMKMGKEYVIFFIENPDYYSFLFARANLKIDLTMGENVDNTPPFQLFIENAYRIYRKLDYVEEDIKYGIVSMWATVHGLAAIASMKNVTTDFKWEEVLERILK